MNTLYKQSGIVGSTAQGIGGAAKGSYGLMRGTANGIEGLGTAVGYVPGRLDRWYSDLGVNNSRLGLAAQTLEEAERIKRDTQKLLMRARIELTKRKEQQDMAGKYLRSGMLG